jgi:hypothetical protein
MHGVSTRALTTLAETSGTTRAAPGLAGLRLVGATAAPRPGRRLAALTPAEPVHGLATVGVTWAPGTDVAEQDIALAVRSLSHGQWSGWTAIPYHDDHGPDPGSAEARAQRPGSDAVYVGEVDDVQVRVLTPTGEPPAGMRLALIDPGRETHPVVAAPAIDPPGPAEDPAALRASPAASAVNQSAATTAATTAYATAAYATAKPQIFSRAQWGADESMRQKSALHYGVVEGGFVHHTVEGGNDYTRAQVPAVIRGIYAFHTQVRGWSDIGYNFLIDRFGRIWEGRYGGVGRPVVGAHTYNYNEYSFGAAALGNFDVYDHGRGIPPQRMLAAFGRLFAWKLSLHGVPAGATHVWVGHRYLPAIDGHRDVYQTACPGRYLYAKLPEIRRLAAADQRAFGSRTLRDDLTGDRWPDLVLRDATKEAYVATTGGQLRFAGRRVAASGFRRADLLAAGADLTGDGHPDIVVRNGRTGVTSLYRGDGNGHFGDPTSMSARYAALDQLVVAGDMDGDGHPDLVGRNATDHRLYLYPGRGDGRFGRARVLSQHWGRYDLTAGVGDLDGDGHPDLVARDGSGTLWLVHGQGAGQLGARTALPGHWAHFDQIAGFGDLTNDRNPDLLARDRRSGTTYIFPGTGTGGFGPRYGGFVGFRGYRLLAAAGHVAGSAYDDVVGVGTSGRLRVFRNTGGTNLTGLIDTGRRFRSANLILNVGDWDGDGHGDVITRSRTGVMYLYPGDGAGHLGSPIRLDTGWGPVRLVAAVGDVTGDGRPDLVGEYGTGPMRIYPGKGDAGFAPSWVVHGRIRGTAQLGVGLFDGDGAPDSVFAHSDGSLTFYRGNGPGGWTSHRKVSGSTSRYDWVVGVGDLDGDGHPDLVGHARSGGRLWLLPGSPSGFAHRRLIGTGFGGYDLG